MKSRIDTSILIFGMYALIMGLVLLTIPHVVLPIFSISVSHEPWMYLLGFVLMCSAYYYIRSALISNRAFALYTVHTRLFAPIVVIYLMVSGRADWHILAFGIVDGLGALWTWIELKREVKNEKKDEVLTAS